MQSSNKIQISSISGEVLNSAKFKEESLQLNLEGK